MREIEKLQKGRDEKILEKVFVFEEGTMSRRRWLEIKKKQGAFVEKEIRDKYKYDRHKANRLSGQAYDDYEKKMEEKIEGYRLENKDGSGYVITKAEYDYFLSLGD